MQLCALGATFQLPVQASSGLNSRNRRRNAKQQLVFPRAQRNAGGDDGPEKSSFDAWFGRFQTALRNGTARYKERFFDELKSEAGVDVKGIYESARSNASKVVNLGSSKGRLLKAKFDERDDIVDDLKRKFWPRFVEWNRWKRWKDFQQWNVKRVGTFFLYVLLVVASFRGLHRVATTPRISKREAERIAEMYLDATIPDPTPENVRKARKMIWREKLPGLRLKKEVLSPDGNFHHDSSFIGETAWQEDDRKGATQEPGKGKLPWPERLAELRKRITEEELKEVVDVATSKYVVLLEAEELKKKILDENKAKPKYGHGFWVARRWWKYRPKLPYFYLLEKVQSGEVKAAVYNPERTKLYVIMKHGFPSEYVVDIPADPFLKDMLLGSGVEVDVMRRSLLLYALRAYAIIMPCILAICILDNTVYTGRQVASEKIFDIINMETSNLIQPWEAREAGFPTFNDVIVNPSVWAVIEEVSNYMSNPMKYYNKKIFLPRGILVHGPPGTGKTHLARAMARQMKLPFIFASGSEFGESDVPGPQKIFELFFTARANAPSVVFIDEIDALAGKHVDQDAKRQLTFRQLLRELDGGPIDTEVNRFSPRQAFILICATNRRDDLHEAFLQPGRIDRELYVGLPSEKQRLRIFDVHTAKFKLAEDIDFAKIVYRTKGFSGADIQNFVSEAAVSARERGREGICQQDLLDVLEKQLFEGIGMAVTADMQKQLEEKVAPEKRRLIAVHEAGHVLLAHLFPRFDWHAFTHLLPGGKESALTVFYPPEDLLERGGTIGYVRAQMVVSHGGHCAERLMYGDDTTDGWTEDLSKISSLARELAVHPSNPRLGLLDVVQKPRPPPSKKPRPPELYPNTWNHPKSVLKPMGPEISELVGREIQRYIDETEKLAMDGLQKNRHILVKLADELEARVKMTGDEAKELIQSLGPIMLEDLLWVPPMKLNPLEGRKPGDPVLYEYEELDVYAAPLHRC